MDLQPRYSHRFRRKLSSFLTFTALLNIHHFILDGAIWKLRDSRIAALLPDGQQKLLAPIRKRKTASRLLLAG
jgi:hypothetical protein